ncbi:PREDICTED: N-alpha-acetyltransferase 60 [Nicrophorus vespilloides]|uniref:N-alpha-acetyltransferase 60 n=1 Tax=Nicrophorus vespilloides TaxID=110193 RepID=A0ABM1MU00_NICVS|nr:PREDICTED: N-alpha-acetyltransferase 60 [Nicrophorus vespilloides]XP_017778051.1 PREDICTED: N-alpha-acetyltransferase 60 [Nicrophorus vespilloides]
MAGFSWYQNNGRDSVEHFVGNGRVPLYSLADVQLRFLCPNDLDEVRALCQDWFPIEYPLSWYEEITSSTSRFYALAAVYNHVIIGLIVAEIKPYASLNTEDTGILAKSFIKSCDVGYILSLGVDKEYRRNGIASLLLDSLIKYLTTNEKKRIKAVFLHVLTTNSAAIMFYESRKFKLHCFLPYYYSIKGRCKDGFTYVLYINGGHPPWTFVDYVKFVCKTVVRGGGIFPWILNSFSRFFYWSVANEEQEHSEH